jgi:hypothetical protein
MRLTAAWALLKGFFGGLIPKAMAVAAKVPWQAWAAIAGLGIAWWLHAGAIERARAEVHAEYAERDRKAAESAMVEWVKLAKEAAASAQVVANAVGLARTLVATTKERTVVRIKEVIHAVEQNPDLAAVRQPDDVVRIHAEAVAESAVAADRARRSFDRGLEAVRQTRAGR